ncbi:MAG: SgcJ/EcaC family oxidoreductase [Planctomycetaceae bacterium]|nr:SgcJ/EcaC family oxidoreductase [Planctomycetaceae bacterium]
MSRLGRTILGVVLAGGLGECGLAAEWSAAQLEELVATSAEQYIKAFHERDAAKLAGFFTESAEYVDADGRVLHGRAAIEADFIATFESSPKGTLSIELTSIRPIAENVIVEEGISEFRPEGDGAVSTLRYSATHVQQKDGEWRIAGVRELSPAEMTAHERLKTLAWLVGRWSDESPDSVVASEWKWSDDENYLIAEFVTKTADGTGRAGSHRVGWDPLRKQFRSWIFDAEGGFAEGTWARHDGVWDVSLTATLAGGATATGVLRFERDGDDAMIVSQLRWAVGGESVPDSETRVVRAPPEPKE